MFERKTTVKHEFHEGHFACAENLEEFACNSCGHSTVFEDSFDKHDCALYSPFRYNFCQKCDFSSHSVLVMLRHVSNNCKLTKTKLQTIKTSRKKTELRLLSSSKQVQCPHCQHRSKTNSHLKAHIRSKHTTLAESEYFKCERCDYKTIYNFVLKRHVTTVHEGVRPERKERWFRCEQCSYRTKYNRDLNRHHIFNHVPSEAVQWFECDQCSYRTKWKGDLKQHARMQHAAPEDIVWFQCDFCRYRGKRKGNLKRHVEHRHGNGRLFEFVDVCPA